jgi:polyhydroxyalkanoate synthesis regulator phasin
MRQSNIDLQRLLVAREKRGNKMANSTDMDIEVEIEEYEAAGKSLFAKATGLVRTTLMVGIGAADLTQEKVLKLWDGTGKMVGDLAERGEKVSEQRRDQFGDVVEKRQGRIKKFSEKAGDSFDKYSEAVLTRVNIPTSDDIEGLSRQVNSLSRKVDKVRKEQQEATA